MQQTPFECNAALCHLNSAVIRDVPLPVPSPEPGPGRPESCSEVFVRDRPLLAGSAQPFSQANDRESTACPAPRRGDVRLPRWGFYFMDFAMERLTRDSSRPSQRFSFAAFGASPSMV